MRDSGLLAALDARGVAAGGALLAVVRGRPRPRPTRTRSTSVPTDRVSVADAVTAVGDAAGADERRVRVTVLDAFAPSDHDAVLDAITRRRRRRRRPRSSSTTPAPRPTR